MNESLRAVPAGLSACTAVMGKASTWKRGLCVFSLLRWQEADRSSQAELELAGSPVCLPRSI